MPAPLVADRWRRPALIAAAAGVVLVVLIGGLTWHETSTRFDTWAFRQVYFRVGHDAAPFFLHVSSPALVFAVLALVGVAAAIGRRWDLAALAAAGPGLAVVLTEYVLKPLFDRPIGSSGSLNGSYPSGHETGVAAAAVVLVVAFGVLPAARVVRALMVVVLLLWTAVAGVGLVRNYYHFATDAIGAVGVSVATVLGVAVVLDRAFLPLTRRRQLTRRS
jgi:membrane-associated phospholipid phosphatase